MAESRRVSCWSAPSNMATTATMILASLRSRPQGTVKLMYQQTTLRHASKSSRGASKKTIKSPASNTIKRADRGSITASTSNATTSSSSSTAAAPMAGENYVKEKVIYQIGPGQNVADARLLLGFGLMFCIFVSQVYFCSML